MIAAGFTALLLSLALTLALEYTAALFLGIRGRQDLLLILTVNLLTNPPAVLLSMIFSALPFSRYLLQLLLEIPVVAGEGLLYQKYGTQISHPWRLSLTANLFSYGTGLALLLLYENFC